jgi:DNA-binding MarR family transcriptional regulator
MTAGALAVYERVQPPSITRTVNCLSELGLLRREPDPSDGRQVILHLSARGEELLAAERRRRDAWLAQRLRELDPADKDILRRAAEILEGLAQA